MLTKLNMLVGEKRRIRLRVHSKKDESFGIRNAKVDFFLYGKSVDSSICEIDEHDLIFIAQFDTKGHYQVVVSYDVADEIIKTRFEIEVE